MSEPTIPRMLILGLTGVPLIKPGDDIGEKLVSAAKQSGISIQNGDIFVVAQTIVSKSEGAIFKLAEIEPSHQAKIIADQTQKDPRIVEVSLCEARNIVRLRGQHLITETRHGWICANSAVDISNVSGGDSVITLPKDPDKSAYNIRESIRNTTGKDVAVIISDTFGRPFRMGQANVAIGVSGINPLLDQRGRKDLFGYVLKVKEIAIGDELASAAELIIGEANEGIPAVIIQGYKFKFDELATSKQLVRPREEDLFI